MVQAGGWALIKVGLMQPGTGEVRVSSWPGIEPMSPRFAPVVRHAGVVPAD
jgi:hypothetical protein